MDKSVYTIDAVDYGKMRVNMHSAIYNPALPEWYRELMQEAYDTLTKMQTKQWDVE